VSESEIRDLCKTFGLAASRESFALSNDSACVARLRVASEVGAADLVSRGGGAATQLPLSVPPEPVDQPAWAGLKGAELSTNPGDVSTERSEARNEPRELIARGLSGGLCHQRTRPS